ncbi:hypothetical protein EDD21DRAFT_233079 [Dissophora ornata]|nr:hypothetical protein EDD21DRAFT_233079 [Dissophora ornata]
MIEQHVVNFLSDFNSHAVMVTMGSSGCFSDSVVGSSHSNSGTVFGLSSVGLGPDRLPSPQATNGLAHSPTLLMNGGLTLLTPQSSGPVAGMLGLGRTTSALTAYHSPSHHPHYQSAEAQETQRRLIDLEFKYRYVVDQLVYYSTIKTGENFFQLASLLFCTLLGNRIFQIWSPAYLKDPRKAVVVNGSPSASGLGSGTGSGVSAAASEYDENGERILIQAGANGFTMQSHNRHHDETQIRVWPDSLRKWVEALDYFVSFFPYHTRQLETLKALHHSLISS